MLLKHASLFSGIGGFDLATEWSGWENMFHCEINPFGQRVLKYYWPNAISYADIKETDFTVWRGRIDVLTGGFPCQPFSLAGKRLGTEDDRNLWPEYYRAIKEIQPTWVVGENVPGLLNWSGGLVFEQVQSDLENEGYEVWPVILPACGVNAPHRRERIWFIAHTKREGLQKPEKSKQLIKLPDVERSNTQDDVTNPYLPGCERPDEQKPFGWSCDTPEPSFDGENGITTDATGDRRERERKEPEIKTGLQQRPKTARELERRFERFSNDRDATDTISLGLRGEGNGIRKSGFINEDGERDFWHNFPTQPAIRSRNDGFSRPLVRYLTKEVINEISNTSKENRIQNLSEMWERVSQKEVWEEVRRFYSLESKEVLFQTMQLYQTENIRQNELSPFSEDFSKPVLQKLRKYGEFRRSPQGQKLQKQRTEQPGNIVSFLPHEIPLAARAFESAMAKFETWHRNESIKAYGNSVVVSVVYQIFKAINQFNETIK